MKKVPLGDRHKFYLLNVEKSSLEKGLSFEEVDNIYGEDFRKTEVLIGQGTFFIVSYEDDTSFYGINELH